MTFESLPIRLTALALLVLSPIGCDGDEGDDELADTTEAGDTTGDGDTTEAGDTTDAGDTTGGSEPDVAAGQAIFEASCAVAGCHSYGDPVMLAQRVPMLDDAALTSQIRNGSMTPSPGGGMPAFGEDQIDAQGLANLIAFLRQMYP